MKAILNQPFFYLDSTKNRWIYILSSTCFVLVFLVLFQPYGITEEVANPINTNASIILFFFTISLATFLGTLLSQFILRPLFKFNTVTNKKYVLWLLFEGLILTLIYFGFSFIIPDLGDDFEAELNIWFQLRNYFRALVILLFPFIGTIIYVLIKDLHIEIEALENKLYDFQKRYKNTNTIKDKTLEILDENNNVELILNLDDFLFAESSNQYVLIHYLKAKQVQKHIVRTRLKNIIEAFKMFPVEQCHRSFAVNLMHIKTLIKREGKTFLVMNDLKTIKVPVSKSYLDTIKRRIEKNTVF